jgi:hypothetical protein
MERTELKSDAIPVFGASPLVFLFVFVVLWIERRASMLDMHSISKLYLQPQSIMEDKLQSCVCIPGNHNTLFSKLFS